MKGSNLHSVHPAFHCFTCCDTSRGKSYLGFSTSNKFLNAWGKIVSTETLLDENVFVACMEMLNL